VLDAAIGGDARLVRHLVKAISHRPSGDVVESGACRRRSDVERDHHAPLL
jgi:hypothetical protein